MQRCPWAILEPNITYHDEEWGVPVHDDRLLFEFLILEGAQAGLSWTTILKKRANYRKARQTRCLSCGWLELAEGFLDGPEKPKPAKVLTIVRDPA